MGRQVITGDKAEIEAPTVSPLPVILSAWLFICKEESRASFLNGFIHDN